MRADGGARLAARTFAQSAAAKQLEVHIAAHSTGSIFMAPLIQLLRFSFRRSARSARENRQELVKRLRDG